MQPTARATTWIVDTAGDLDIQASGGDLTISGAGAACAGCTVEAFVSTAADGEGETFVGDTVAGGGGAFTVAVPIASLLNQSYLTVTATDAASGTSEFSAVYTIEVEAVYLPLVLRSSP